jgi:hypothetical protein
MDHTMELGHVFYLVKWAGWNDPRDMTWEPDENIKDCRYHLFLYQKTLVPFSIVAPPARDQS